MSETDKKMKEWWSLFTFGNFNTREEYRAALRQSLVEMGKLVDQLKACRETIEMARLTNKALLIERDIGLKVASELKACREECANGKCDGYDKGYLDSKYEVELIEHLTKEACFESAWKWFLEMRFVNIVHSAQKRGLKAAIDNCKTEEATP